MNFLNSVIISGLVHHLAQKKENNYFPFSIRHENLWQDGTTRKDFLNARAFSESVQEILKSLPENSPVKVKGVLRSSKGSGELYLAVSEVEVLNAISNPLENLVEISGQVHFVKAQAEGETGTGKYIRFAVKQEFQDEKGHLSKDFLVVRVYDEEQRKILESMNDGQDVKVNGTLRSSRGSGVNYIRAVSIWK